MKPKRYVQVIARHDEDGATRPLQIILDDGRAYHIDDVRMVRRMTELKQCWADPDTTRYTVRIGSTVTNLFEEYCNNGYEETRTRWYVVVE